MKTTPNLTQPRKAAFLVAVLLMLATSMARAGMDLAPSASHQPPASKESLPSIAGTRQWQPWQGVTLQPSITRDLLRVRQETPPLQFLRPSLTGQNSVRERSPAPQLMQPRPLRVAIISIQF
ncbi:MAG: hypothetical protein AAB676_11500 [Verrucomicrobiota bacterium]